MNIIAMKISRFQYRTAEQKCLQEPAHKHIENSHQDPRAESLSEEGSSTTSGRSAAAWQCLQGEIR